MMENATSSHPCNSSKLEQAIGSSFTHLMAIQQTMTDSTQHASRQAASHDRNLVLISANPKAGARSGNNLLEELYESLESRGFELVHISRIDDLAPGIESAHQTGRLRTIIACGGDGTAALVTNHAPPSTPICIFPLGTENLLAKYLELKPDPEATADLVAQGQSVALDAGKAGDRIFLLMAGCGFDAQVVHQLHASRTGHIRKWSYFKPILKSIWNYRYPRIRITFPDGPENAELSEKPLPASWVFLCNLPRYAFGLPVARGADGRDGLLDIRSFRRGYFFPALRYLAGLYFGDCWSWRDCQALRASKIRLEADEPVPVQLDGDPAGFLPMDFEILPKRLNVLVSKAWADKHGFPKSAELE